MTLTPSLTPRILLGFALLLAAGTALRVMDAARPYDHRSLAPWREADYAQIARAYAREDARPWNPRVDWRGETDGRAEMELPILPWTAGMAERAFGGEQAWMRWLSALASVASLVAFAGLARRLMSASGAWVATAVFAVNPLLVYLGASMQPEPIVLAASICAVASLARWHAGGPASLLVGSGAWLALAILAKVSAAHLGVLWLAACLHRLGPRALLRGSVWATGAVAVLPAVAWYAWAHHLYRTTGLSLGVSNESHFVTWETLKAPMAALKGNLRSELWWVFGGVAWIAPLAWGIAAWRRRPSGASIAPSTWFLLVAWYGAACVFYALAADTCGDRWAFYYHAASVPPVALLVGAFVGALRGPGLRVGVASVILAGQLVATDQLRQDRDHQPFGAEQFAQFDALRDAVPAEARIVLRGGPSVDRRGQPVAYHQSMAYAWLDRKGFSYPSDRASLETLRALRQRGATHWIAQGQEEQRAANEWKESLGLTLVAREGRLRLYRMHGGAPEEALDNG